MVVNDGHDEVLSVTDLDWDLASRFDLLEPQSAVLVEESSERGRHKGLLDRRKHSPEIRTNTPIREKSLRTTGVHFQPFTVSRIRRDGNVHHTSIHPCLLEVLSPVVAPPYDDWTAPLLSKGNKPRFNVLKRYNEDGITRITLQQTLQH